MFYKTHLEKWQENAAEIGISEEDVAAMADLVEQARAAYNEQKQKQNAARSATIKLQGAQKKMNNFGRNLILRMRATAQIEGDPVYAKASLPLPKKASPVGEPGEPKNFKMKMDPAIGTLALSWKCENPVNASGTIYIVSRSVNNGALEQLGMTGKKKFVDTSLPKGSTYITYQVRAMRGGTVGPIGTYVVNFSFSAPKEVRNQYPHQHHLAA